MFDLSAIDYKSEVLYGNPEEYGFITDEEEEGEQEYSDEPEDADDNTDTCTDEINQVMLITYVL